MMLYVDNPRDTAPKRLGRGDFEALIGDSQVARCCMWASRYAEALQMARERGVAVQTEWWERELKHAKGKLPAFIFQGDMASADYLGKPGTRNGRYIVSKSE